jgi:hypothetical protein
MLCDICAPLDWNPESLYTRYIALHKFQLGDIPVVDRFVPLPTPCFAVEDGVFIFMECLVSGGDELKVVGVNDICLNTITEVHQGANRQNKLRRGNTSDCANEVSLNVMVNSPSNLLQFGDPALEVMVSRNGLQNRESKSSLESLRRLRHHLTS